MHWSARGTYFEACNCLAICPCRQVGGRDGGRSTYGVCDFTLSWWVREGHFGSRDLSDRRVVMVGSYADDDPGSPWTVNLYVDDGADEGQHSALRDIFLGRAGGTPEKNYAPAITTVADVRPALIELDHTPGRWSIRVVADPAGSVDVTAGESVDSDEPVACGIPGLDHPGTEVRSSLMRVESPALRWEWNDRCGFATDFAYSSDS